jgi:hypothetical protein
MYLVLSAFTTRPISLLATTKASKVYISYQNSIIYLRVFSCLQPAYPFIHSSFSYITITLIIVTVPIDPWAHSNKRHRVPSSDSYPFCYFVNATVKSWSCTSFDWIINSYYCSNSRHESVILSFTLTYHLIDFYFFQFYFWALHLPIMFYLTYFLFGTK